MPGPIAVAVVDSGAHVPHPHLPRIAGGIAFDLEGRASDDITDRLGHGTAAAAAIHEKAPDADLHIVKVFDRELATTVSTLVRAIDWAIDEGCRIVNLSLGTPHDFRRAELEPAVARAVDAGVIVVSAQEHDDQLWYPGSIEGALGVVMDASQPRGSVRGAIVDSGPVVVASPFARPIPGVPPERNLNGISFAVANVSGVLAARMTAHPEIRTAAEARDALTLG
ncbi:MAG: S8 family serine peptidase [Gemmatimonadota bacterium]